MSAATSKQVKKSSGVHGKGGGPVAIKKFPAGIVNSYLHRDPSRKLVATKISEKLAPSNLVQVIQDGLPVKELEDLQASLGVPMETLYQLLGISKATHHRRKVSGTLDPGVS